MPCACPPSRRAEVFAGPIGVGGARPAPRYTEGMVRTPPGPRGLCVWLATSLLLACAHASPGSERARRVIVRECGPPLRFDGGPGALPYTTDGDNSVYIIVHPR